MKEQKTVPQADNLAAVELKRKQLQCARAAFELSERKRDGSPFFIRLRLLELALEIVRENAPDGVSADCVIGQAERLNAFVSGRGGGYVDPDKEKAAEQAARDAGLRA